MMRYISNQTLEHIGPNALVSPHATHERVGCSRVYLRPIQEDLDLSPTEEGTANTNTVCVNNLFQAFKTMSILTNFPEHVYTQFFW